MIAVAPTQTATSTPVATSAYERLVVPDESTRMRLRAAMSADLVSAEFLAREQAALLAYGSGPAPLFSRLPIPYRIVPLRVRSALLSALFHRQHRRLGETVSPHWPIERALDDERRERWTAAAATAGIGLSTPT